jgi:hypothetical protein
VDQTPDQRPLIDLMLGQQVAVKYLSGPDITEDNVEQIVEEGRVLKGPPEARTAAFYLRGYSDLGIEVSRMGERGNAFFIPWGAVLAIWGSSREDLERTAREATDQEQPMLTGGGEPPRHRRELMSQVGGARTPSEVANARAAANNWLAAHSDDGDVRMARERLQAEYPEEDLEEGSPT